MNLLKKYLELITEARYTFSSKSSLAKSVLHALVELFHVPRKTITTFLELLGLQLQDYSSHYKFYSRSKWDPQELFQPVIRRAGTYFTEDFIQLSADYTSLKKTGRHIPNTGWIRDPMSPKFRPNLSWGMTFLQVAVNLPLYQSTNAPARSLPIRWHLLPKMPKPSKRASEEEVNAYELFTKENNRSKIFIEKLKDVRTSFDVAGFQDKKLLVSLDGEFCNKRVLNADLSNISLVLRCRKNIKLCFQDTSGGRRFYSKTKFTPEEIRQNDQIEWTKTSIFHGGDWREVYYKEVKQVYWQGGSKRKELRLIVLRPVPYRKTKTGRMYYRQPAYLLCTDLKLTVEKTIQAYFDRWEIEVNHKDEKDVLGVGQAQLRNPKAVEAQPVHLVAAYSNLMLVGIQESENKDWREYVEKTSWYRTRRRVSFRDLSRMLQKEIQLCTTEDLFELLAS